MEMSLSALQSCCSVLTLLVVNKDLSELTVECGLGKDMVLSDLGQPALLDRTQKRCDASGPGIGNLGEHTVGLWAKMLQKPVWRVVADMTPEEVVCCIDVSYIMDVLMLEEALELLCAVQSGKEETGEDLSP